MRSVAICGSRRFREEIREFADSLRKMGVLVFEPALPEHKWENMSSEVKRDVAKGLTFHHFEKIRKADVCFIFNKSGYIGASVTLELGYAVACHKPIFALAEDKTEIFRDVLFDGIASSPQELKKYL